MKKDQESTQSPPEKTPEEIQAEIVAQQEEKAKAAAAEAEKNNKERAAAKDKVAKVSMCLPSGTQLVAGQKVKLAKADEDHLTKLFGSLNKAVE